MNTNIIETGTEGLKIDYSGQPEWSKLVDPMLNKDPLRLSSVMLTHQYRDHIDEGPISFAYPQRFQATFMSTVQLRTIKLMQTERYSVPNAQPSVLSTDQAILTTASASFSKKKTQCLQENTGVL
jgi:hypothetical protein